MTIRYHLSQEKNHPTIHGVDRTRRSLVNKKRISYPILPFSRFEFRLWFALNFEHADEVDNSFSKSSSTTYEHS